jgi:hypothetical protein
MRVARSAEPPRECQPALMEAGLLWPRSDETGTPPRVHRRFRCTNFAATTFDLTAERFALARGHHDHNPQRMPAGRLGAQCVVVAGSGSPHLWPLSGFKSKLFVFFAFQFRTFFVLLRTEMLSASLVSFLRVGIWPFSFSYHFLGLAVISLVSLDSYFVNFVIFCFQLLVVFFRQRLDLLKKLSFWLSFSF